MVRRTLIFLAAVTAVSLAGCSRQWYRADADRQVKQILADRKQQTLGYQPEVEAASPPEEKVLRKAYSRLPTTPLPPPEPSPIEPSRLVVPFAPLGPEMHLPPGVPPPQTDDGQVEAQPPPQRRTPRRLVLGPPAPGDHVVKVDLFKSLEYAVQHSRAYQTQMEQLYLAALDVTLERHLFTPRPFANASYIYEGGQADVNYRSAMVATMQAGVRQRLPYGGEVVASGLVQFVDALNETTADGESAELAISASIPLLRGAGMVNLEALINSERQLIYAVRDFEEFRRSFAVDVATAYFGILRAQQSVVNRRTSYNNLQTLLERSQALYQAGKLNFLRVQVSGSSLYRAENRLIDAEESLAAAIDNFKLLIGMDLEVELLVMPTQLDVDVPDVDNRNVIRTAHKYRLDLRTARDIADDAQRRAKNAANGLLPDLDVVAQASAGNRPFNPARRLDDRTGEYSAGIQLDLPVDRLAERNLYRRALIGVDRARRDVEQLKDAIAAQVLDRIRAIRSAEATLEIQTRSIELAIRRLEYANDLLTLGRDTDTRNVTEAQETLLTAQDSYETARANLQVEILRFLRDTGTLRLDPQAGALGVAMDRAQALVTQ